MKKLLTIIILLLIVGCTTAPVRSGNSDFIDEIDNSGVFDSSHDVSKAELKIIRGALRGAATDLKSANKKIKLLGQKIDNLEKDIDKKNAEIVELNKAVSEEKVFSLKLVIALVSIMVLLIGSVFLNIKSFWRL